MAKIIVYAAAICGALPVDGAKVYINGAFCGETGANGYSEAFCAEGNICTVSVAAEGYEEYFVPEVKLYEGAAVVWSAMLERSKVK